MRESERKRKKEMDRVRVNRGTERHMCKERMREKERKKEMDRQR